MPSSCSKSIIAIPSLSAKSDWIDAEAGVLVFVLIAIDKVHHFLFGSAVLRNAGYLTPLIDGIANSGISTLAILEDVSVGSDVALFGKEVFSSWV